MRLLDKYSALIDGDNLLNRYTTLIDGDNVVAYFSPKMIDRKNVKPSIQKHIINANKEFFEIGKHYTIGGEECDGEKLSQKEFELIAIVDKIDDITIDSVILKQISGPDGMIFSLSKQDCRKLNIQFQEGLIIFPKTMEWVKVNEDIVIEEETQNNNEEDVIFNSRDLRTYPLDYRSKTIKRMTIKIHGVRCGFNYNNGAYIILPNGKTIQHERFLDLVRVVNKVPLLRHDGTTLLQYTNISYRVITEFINEAPMISNSTLIDRNGNMFLELIFASNDDSDGLIPYQLHGNVNDFFLIYTI